MQSLYRMISCMCIVQVRKHHIGNVMFSCFKGLIRMIISVIFIDYVLENFYVVFPDVILCILERFRFDLIYAFDWSIG